MGRARRPMPWFVRGDIDGFFGLAVDNLVQLLVIQQLCSGVLGFGPGLLYGRILPAVAISLVVGNVYYAWQARALSARLGRSNLCALPYGINTPSIFAYIFLVMLPARQAALGRGLDEAAAAEVAWHAGLVACIGSGLIELAGSFIAERIRRVAPRAALLSTLSGIALTFISIGFLFSTFGKPVVGMTTLAVILLAYFGRVRFRGGVPGGLVAVLAGALLAWLSGLAPGPTPGAAALHLPVPVSGDLLAASTGPYWIRYLSVILPMGLFNVIGSLQNIESAEAAGDPYPTRPALAVNGLGTLAAALFGSCFPTTIYIGHPGWKAMGARAGYSILNAVFIGGLCLTGTVAHVAWLVPLEAGMAIVLWIGIVITAQAFSSTPRAHAPATVVGLLPGVAAWGALMAKQGLLVGGLGPPDAFFDQRAEEIVRGFARFSTDIHGAFALEQGFILSAMILAAATVLVIERRFVAAAGWCAAGAALTSVGLMHSYRWTAADTAIALGWPWDPPNGAVVLGYTLMAVIFFSARWATEPLPDDDPVHANEKHEETKARGHEDQRW